MRTNIDFLPTDIAVTVTSTSAKLSALVTTASGTWPTGNYNRITVKHSGTVYASNGTAAATSYPLDSGEVIHGGNVLKDLQLYAASDTTVVLMFWQEGY